jgi:hypothetical protein
MKVAKAKAKAKAKGRLRGKQPKLSASPQEHFVKLDDDEEKNAVELAKLFGVGPLHRVPNARLGTG